MATTWPIDTLAREAALTTRSRLRQTRSIAGIRAEQLRRTVAHPSEWRAARAQGAEQAFATRRIGRFERIVIRETARVDQLARRTGRRLEEAEYRHLEAESPGTGNRARRETGGERRERHRREAHQAGDEAARRQRAHGRRRAWRAALAAYDKQYGAGEKAERQRIAELDQEARRRKPTSEISQSAVRSGLSNTRAKTDATAGTQQGKDGRKREREPLAVRFQRTLDDYADGERRLDDDVKRLKNRVMTRIREAGHRTLRSPLVLGQAAVRTTVTQPAALIGRAIRKVVVGAGQRVLNWQDRNPGESEGTGRDPLVGLRSGTRRTGSRHGPADPLNTRTSAPGTRQEAGGRLNPTRAAMLAHDSSLTHDAGRDIGAERPRKQTVDREPADRSRTPAYAH